MNKAEKQAERIRKEIEELYNEPAMKIESLKFDITEEISKHMAGNNISRVELAEKMGTSRAYITKMLRGDTNFTLETLVKIAGALGCSANFRLCPEGFSVSHLSVFTSRTVDASLSDFSGRDKYVPANPKQIGETANDESYNAA